VFGSGDGVVVAVARDCGRLPHPGSPAVDDPKGALIAEHHLRPVAGRRTSMLPAEGQSLLYHLVSQEWLLGGDPGGDLSSFWMISWIYRTDKTLILGTSFLTYLAVLMGNCRTCCFSLVIVMVLSLLFGPGLVLVADGGIGGRLLEAANCFLTALGWQPKHERFRLF
jgi:hypothetical protein